MYSSSRIWVVLLKSSHYTDLLVIISVQQEIQVRSHQMDDREDNTISYKKLTNRRRHSREGDNTKKF